MKSKKFKKSSNQNSFAKLSIFHNQKFKFKKKCPLSGKGAPKIDYKNIKLLKKYTQTEIDMKFWAARRIFEKNSQPLRKIKLRASQQYLASAIDVLRHAGYEDWKLYSRWNENGIADLLAHYVEKYIATKKTGWLNFDKFLYEKGIINQINTIIFRNAGRHFNRLIIYSQS